MSRRADLRARGTFARASFSDLVRAGADRTVSREEADGGQHPFSKLDVIAHEPYDPDGKCEHHRDHQDQ